MDAGLSWQVIGMLAVIVSAWSALLLSVIRWFLARHHEGIKERFNTLETVLSIQSGEMHRIDKDILRLRAELPEQYVRREDHIRFDTVINAKLDALSSEIKLGNERRMHGTRD